MTTLTINGKLIRVPEGTSVLRAAETAGITIPTLCDHPDLSAFGGCRLCIVEVKGARLPATACTLQAAEGMVVKTETPALIQSRRFILEMLLSSYYDANDRPEQVETQLLHWVKHYGLDLSATTAREPRYPVDSDPNPFVRVDLNKCILCTRCIRACAEIQGRFVWGLAERGYDAHIVAGASTDMIDARCESCGACVAYCPTGALENRMSAESGPADKLVTTTCTYCGVGCQYDLNVKDGKIIRVTSNPNAPVNGMHLCVKGRYGYDFVHHPDRLTKPKVRRYLLDEGRTFAGSYSQKGSGAHTGERQTKDEIVDPSSFVCRSSDWVEVDWPTALAITARKLRETRDTYGPDSVGILTSAKCLNEENYLMNKFARQVIGTNSIDHCARL